MLSRPIALALLTLLSLSCAKSAGFGPNDLGGDVAGRPDFSPSDLYQSPCNSPDTPSLSGTVYAPNGVDPIAGAVVGIPLTVPNLPPRARCTSCAEGAGFRTMVYSDARGRFHLRGVPADGAPFRLVMQKGYFRRVLTLDAPGCTSRPLEAALTTLPGKTAHYGPADTVPRIAVVSGAWDQLEKVLTKLGLEEFELYDGTALGAEAEALLASSTRMAPYHMIFINCGNRFERAFTETLGAATALRSYVEAGGRLFVTDYSYDFVEQAFPEFIDFEGSHDGEPLQKAESLNAAEVGLEGLVVEAEVLDAPLREWLGLPELGALLPNGRLQVVGFQTGWAVQREVVGKVWVQGEVLGVGVTQDTPRPLTSSFDLRSGDQQCGRVVFSSYHTHGAEPQLLPQERVLEYLIFELGACPRVL